MRLRGGGSSPRVRGKRAPGALQGRSVRLIPARAGKTRLRAGEAVRLPAHPRACGENRNFPEYRPKRLGSSPRVRGKRPDLVSGEVGARLIPARAGKTRSGVAVRSSSSAHPRACGENWSTASRRSTASGSSPRVRGKRLQAAPHRSDAGLIPARAGKTSISATGHPCLWAHPRACGENLWGSEVVVSPGGSSPRVRGKPVGERGRCFAGGLIPARAGKTPSARPVGGTGVAHPRACGENLNLVMIDEAWAGSSPRVRGKPRGGARDPAAPGLIPARAGKTRTRATSPTAPWAHPRACGENSTNHPRPRSSRGSSPRVRGKRLVEFFGRDLARLIPARAGKTPPRPRPPLQPPAHPRACGENARARCRRR